MQLEGSYTAKQVVKFTGVTYETLNHWAKIGLVKPSVSAARGSGSRRRYDFQDLIAIRVALKLRRSGIFGKALARIVSGRLGAVLTRITEACGVRLAPSCLDSLHQARPGEGFGLAFADLQEMQVRR